MLRQGFSLLISCIWFLSVQAQTLQESYTLSDSGESYKLILAYDNGKQPVYFFRDIFTPVCLDDVCKPVRITLFWDLLGNYLRYEVPKDEPLTKLDHADFTAADHAKLQEILLNENSLLKDFKMEDLVDSSSQRLSDSVDAVTGATKNTVKGEVIEGALYTCYTLWHLAHGATVDDIKKLTRKKLDEPMLHRFLRSDNFHYVYFALDEVMDAQGLVHDAYLADVLTLLASDNVFAARYVWQKINLRYFTSADEQGALWRIFLQASYTQQVALLKRMVELELDAGIIQQITDYLPQLNQALFKQALIVLAGQKVLPQGSQKALMAYLNAADRERAKTVYEALREHVPLNEAFKEQLRSYKP